jgi:hypothetical protein
MSGNLQKRENVSYAKADWSSECLETMGLCGIGIGRLNAIEDRESDGS